MSIEMTPETLYQVC